MDSSLAAVKGVWVSLPLRPQSHLFCLVADRASALPAVASVVGMSLRAMGFPQIPRGYPVRLPQNVVSHGSETQMGDIDTISRFTTVVNHAPFRDRPECVVVRDSMCSAALSAKEEVTVPVTVHGASPSDALAPRLGFQLESGQLFGG